MGYEDRDVVQAFELSIAELFRQTVHRPIQQLLDKLPLTICNISIQRRKPYDEGQQQRNDKDGGGSQGSHMWLTLS